MALRQRPRAIWHDDDEEDFKSLTPMKENTNGGQDRGRKRDERE